MNGYNPSRIVLMRRIEKITQSELAEKTGLSGATLSKLQNNIIPFNESEAKKIAFAVDYPLSFFKFNDELMPPSLLTYRRTSKTSVREINAVAAEFEVLTGTVKRLSEQLHMKPRLSWLEEIAPRVENPLCITDINRLAEQTRNALGLASSGPVQNVTRSLERAGIVIAPMYSSGEKSGYATTSEGVTRPDPECSNPVLGYLNRSNTGDRLRFTKAHELGHLVLHRYRDSLTRQQKEKEAHQFAGAFLMPEIDARQEISESSNLSSFVALKAKWGISIAALIMRANAIDVIDSQRARSLQIQLSVRGWKKHEPVAVEVEHPVLLKQMIGQTYGHMLSPTTASISSLTAAVELGVPFRFLDLWSDGLKVETENLGIDEKRFEKASITPIAS